MSAINIVLHQIAVAKDIMGEIGQFEDADIAEVVTRGGIEIISDVLKSAKIVGEKGGSEDTFSDDCYDYSDEDDFVDDYVEIDGDTKKGGNRDQQVASIKVCKFHPSKKKFSSKIHVGQYDAEAGKVGGKVRDKADRTTVEQVMDPRTRMILFKLLNRGDISRDL